MAEQKTKAKGGFKSSAAQSEKPRVDPGAGTVDDVKVTHLQVRSLVAGFRRAGRAWPAEDVTVDVGEFTVEQVEQLVSEPMLVVLPISAAVEK